MRHNTLSIFAIITTLSVFSLCSPTAHAQGQMPVPDISGATVSAQASFLTDPLFGGEAEYVYTITSPATAEGFIWLLKVDVSSLERGDIGGIGRTYPVQGGLATASMDDEADFYVPVEGLKGTEVVVVGQTAPSGWNGGMNVQGYATFAAVDTTVAVAPGSSMSGFVMTSHRPPTIREVSITPHWILVVEDHSLVTDQDLEDAYVTKQSLPITTFSLGPMDIEVGGQPHYSRLSSDMRRAEGLGWTTDATLVNDLEASLGAARTHVFEGNNGLAIAELENMQTLIAAADPTTTNREFIDLVSMNVEWLIERVPNLRNTFIPVFTATPESATLPRDETFTLTMKHFNSALEGNPPIENLRVLVRCVADRPCANADQLIPGSDFRIDETGEQLFSYVGNNAGLDVIEVVENDFEAFRRLALVEVNWTADADLVVPAFVPPVIMAGSGDSIFVTDRTRNIGVQDVAVSTTTTYYISDTDPIDIATATVLGSRTVPPLASGEASDSMEVPYTIPAGFDGEFNVLAACADTGKVVPESNEDNNCSFAEIYREFDAVGFMEEGGGLPTINVAGTEQAEGNVGTTDLLFDVSISAADPVADITVTFRTTDDSAVAGEDFELTDIQVVFPAGTAQLTQSVPVGIFGDFEVELDETFTVELIDASANALIGAGSAVGTIENDDLVAVSVSNVSALEGDAGNTVFGFSVIIDQPHPTESVDVTLQTVDGTALQVSDYLSATPTVSFGAGSTVLTQIVDISVVGDLDIEADEDFSLEITSVSANAAILDGIGVGTILNDDSPPQLDCSNAVATPDTLWPPNHKLTDVTLGGVFAENGDLAEIIVTGIEQDEPVNGLGDGDTSPDGFGVGTATPELRRERSGTGDGRVYIVSFTATDTITGATCDTSVTVGVPHDQGQGSEPIDSGVRYDSTVE